MKLSAELTAKILSMADRVDGQPVAPLADTIDEKDFQAAVIKLAKRNGWKVHYTTNSRRSPDGWPDLILSSSARGKFLVRELKTEKGKPTSGQLDWLEELQALGIDAGVWRPRDFVEIERMLTEHAKRVQ